MEVIKSISPAGIPHELTADQGNAFSMMVVKTPNPQCFGKNQRRFYHE